LCRRLETEKEKVLPFYEAVIGEADVPEEIRKEFEHITKEQY